MILNYLIISLRNISKHKLYSLINISSLALGIAACLVIYLFISDELNFDGFHQQKTELYRLNEVQSFTGTNVQHVALSMPGMGPALQTDFPEIVKYTRFWGRGKQLYTHDSKELLIEKSAFVDSTFLELFGFKLITGDRNTALNAPDAIVLTKKASDLFFASPEEAMGKMLEMNEDLYKVTGVLEDVPENSHLQFDALLSMGTVIRGNPDFNEQWGSNFLVTYLQLTADADLAKLEASYPDFLIRQTDNEEVNDYYKLYLQPLSDVHLNSTTVEHDYHNYRKFDGSYINIFTVIGIFILLIASVNFMNLATAKASYRIKEVGVRKSIGAFKGQLFGQFALEAVVLGFLAFVLALILAALFTPVLNSLIGRSLSVMTLFTDPMAISLALLASFSLGLLASIYPAIYLSSFKPANILKGNSTQGKKSIGRSALVVFQFGLAIAMIVSTLVVMRQLNFMQFSDIGFKTDQIILVDMNGTANEAFSTLKTELKKSSNVLGVTASGQRLGNNFHQWGFKLRTDTAIVDYTPSNVNVDFDYLDVYDIKMADGRTFDESIPTDNGFAFIVNETFAKDMNLDKAVGMAAGHGWYDDDSLGQIIGVAADFNFNSLHYKINTLAMAVHTEWGYDELSIKVNGNNIEAALADIETTWAELVPDWPFQYSFLDEHFEEMYRSDRQLTSVVSIMAFLAIIIAAMGLFGLSSITTERRTKEIGIRKVLGASVATIVTQSSSRFALLVLLAFLLISPFTYVLLERWLSSFAYRIDINPLLFLLGGMMALVIAMLTISYHTIRSAVKNPVNTLRYE